MKPTSQIIIFILAILTSMVSAHAQSPREQLKVLVEQLQKTPTDNALREKIINLAASMKPAPAIPDEGIRFEGRGQYAFKAAKTDDDYLTAAQEYEKAVAAAPWVLGYYSDLCTIYDKAGKPVDAKRNCSFYLIGLSDPDRITDTKRRIAGLEFGIEKAASNKAESDKAAQAAKAKADETLIVPGERIGQIRLGMPMSDVVKILGRPSSDISKYEGGAGMYRWVSFNIVHDEQMNVYRIYVLSPEYRTRSGVGVGSNFDEARREFGEPLKERSGGEFRVVCFALGTEVTMKLATGRITSIEVAYRCQQGY